MMHELSIVQFLGTRKISLGTDLAVALAHDLLRGDTGGHFRGWPTPISAKTKYSIAISYLVWRCVSTTTIATQRLVDVRLWMLICGRLHVVTSSDMSQRSHLKALADAQPSPPSISQD